MKTGVNVKELKEIEKKILKGINLNNTINDIKLIGGFDIAYKNNKYVCAAVVIDFNTKEVVEKNIATGEEIMSYSPTLAVFREGPAIIDAYRGLENKPDVLMIKGNSALQKFKAGLASYVGVLLNKPCIGVAKELLFGRLDEDRIIVDNELKGMAIKTKEFSNPVYVSPGHGISLDKAVEITKSLIRDPYKMPLPLHFAHKLANKEKKQ